MSRWHAHGPSHRDSAAEAGAAPSQAVTFRCHGEVLSVEPAANLLGGGVADRAPADRVADEESLGVCVREERPMRDRDPKGGTSAPRVWWALPLAIWALSVAGVAALARRQIVLPPTLPTFHLFFSDYPHMKIWLATVVVVLACGQLLWAARLYGLLRMPPRGRFYAIVHRSAGWMTLLLTLPIAYHCLILVGQNPIDLRVGVHAALGAFLYGMVATKVLVVRSRGLRGWVLPAAGGLLFTVLVGLWLTSVPWFVSVYGIGL